MGDKYRESRQLGRFLPKNLAEKWSERNQARSGLERLWQEAIEDQDLRTHLTPVSINQGVIIISSNVPAWIARARHMKQEILEQLRSHPEGRKLLGLRFRVNPSVPVTLPGLQNKVPIRKPHLSHAAARTISETAQAVKDDELREALERLGRHESDRNKKQSS